MDTTRALLTAPSPENRSPENPLARVARATRQHALANPRLSAIGAWGAHWAARLRLGSMLPRTSRLGRTLRHTAPALNSSSRSLKTELRSVTQYLAADASSADVFLFTGCMAGFFSSRDIAAAIRVLAAVGLKTHIPPGQVCCGAMDQHLGYPAAAARLRETNSAAFAFDRPIIVLDSGCQAELREYPESAWRQKTFSLPDFLVTLPPERLRQAFGGLLANAQSSPSEGAKNHARGTSASPAAVRIALHLPCTLRNVVRRAAERSAFYAGLPAVTVVTSHPATGCCGAGGTAMLTQPAMADALGRATLAALEHSQPDWIVSDNVGCRVHLAAMAEQSQNSIPVISGARFLASRLHRGN